MRVTALLAIGVWSVGGAAQVAPRCLPGTDCVPPIGIRVGGPRIERTASDVRVTLDGRVLRYEIAEAFVNRGGVVGEADYVIPLPRGAAFEDLALEINGELVTGEALTAERARTVYEEIVRKVRDPALVEWMGHGLLRARIFPIAPGETKRVVVRFRAVAEREGNALRVEYLSGGRSAEQRDAPPPSSLLLMVPNDPAFGTPFSPTHQLDVGSPIASTGVRYREVRVRGDASRLTVLVPVRDNTSATLTAIAYAPPGDDGFAMITVSPPANRHVSMPRDVTFVVDVSGSMSGEKLAQAKAAGRTLLGTLTPADRFRLVSFSTDVDEFRDGWSTVTGANIRGAQRWLDDLRATGSTNIEGALDRALSAVVPGGRLGLVLFLTDGAATVGERSPDGLASLAARRRGAQRVFTFGVGADVQAAMLERIALEGHGTAHFVQPNEDVEHAVGVVAQRLTAPVATGLRLHADGLVLRQQQPDGPQDLFVGQELTYFVRYRAGGTGTISLQGDSPEGVVRWSGRVTLPERSRDNAFIAKLWAVQRVGWLSAERRRVGANPELDNELRELGTRYGIPTELTSYLVLEPGMSMQSVRGGRGSGTPPAEFAAARAAAEQRAVKSLADAASAGQVLRPSASNMARNDAATPPPRQVGDRVFVLRDGQWTDTRYRDDLRRVTIKPYSSAYFALITAQPDLAAVLAVGDRVAIGGRRVAIVVQGDGVTELSASELAAVIRDW